MIELEAAGATDVGKVRRNNQDSFLMGDSVFAVADGMGGHLAGEVASATALQPIEQLDGKVFPDAPAATRAVVDAVVTANGDVSRMSSSDAQYQGMGTTLTAALFEGRRLHIAHVGDSRAYLLRDGELSQITTDHTLVQHLIDEGQITPEEAATHPQRSIITRAIGVAEDVEVDAVSLELQPGDVILLCSDGLSGFVTDAAVKHVLLNGSPLESQVDELIELANDAGGGDNITAVVLRYGAPSDEDVAAAAASVEADTQPNALTDGDEADDDGEDAADGRGEPVRVRTSGEADDTDWARRLGRFGSLGADKDERNTGDGRTRRIVAVAAALLLVLVLGVAGGRWLLSRSYYVGVHPDSDTVAIYQGIPVEVGPLELSWVVERTGLRLEELPDYFVESLRDGIAAIDRRDARLIVENAPRRDDAPTDDAPTDEPTTGPTTAPSPGSAGAPTVVAATVP